jgi:hypothetical protein
VLTWPLVFVRGAFLSGGGSAVARMHEEGSIAQAAAAPRTAFAPLPVRVETQPRPLLLHHAGGGPWLGCQSRIYGNVLRGIAMLQVALLAAAYHLEQTGQAAAALPLLILLALDSLLFVRPAGATSISDAQLHSDAQLQPLPQA